MCELTLEAAGLPRPATHPKVYRLHWEVRGSSGSTAIHAYSHEDAKAYFDYQFGRHGYHLNEITVEG